MPRRANRGNIAHPHFRPESPVMRVAALLCVLIPAVASAQGAAPPPPPPKPEVYFHAPANNATVTSPFAVKFGLKNYGVAPAAINVARTGHFHIQIGRAHV